MATEFSFDAVSKVDLQEVTNALNQAEKEIGQRYDFKGSKTELSLEGQTIKIVAADDFKLKSVIDILKTKLITRKVPVKNLDYAKVEEASGGSKRQLITIKQGIESETAKKMAKDIKGLNLKVQTQIMGDQLRVSGKNKDDLQAAIRFLREKDYGLELQFINFR